MLPFQHSLKPRRRKYVGKHKKQYQDTDFNLGNQKVNKLEKQEYLLRFKETKLKEKRQRKNLLYVLIVVGLIVLGIMFFMPIN